MKIEPARFIELRDGRDTPKTDDEMLELARFTFRCTSAKIEQALQQRRKPTPQEIRQIEIDAVKQIIGIYKSFVEKSV